MQNNPLTAPIIYPDSDGMPLADNTRQAEWIVVLFDNLTAQFHDRPDVFVAADNLWYPVQGRPDIRVAPDVYLAFGRPKGYRGSYRQWEEGDVPLTVAFEVLSPGNSDREMADKLAFYDEYGVEEYYVYDPDRNHLQVYLRRGTALLRVRKLEEFVSPRLGIRFEFLEDDMRVYGPGGEPFRTFVEIVAERDEANRQAAAMVRRADDERQRADDERRRADTERQRADDERQRADDERRRADRLAARLRELGIDPDA